MLNSEYYRLRYRIPDFVYMAPPSLDLVYDVFLAKKDLYIPDEIEKMDLYTWVNIGKCYADTMGNVFSDIEKTLPFELILGDEYGTTHKIKITEFTTFILKFVNITQEGSEKIHYASFQTGLNMGMYDSPYRDKVLMPEQTYAITYNVEACDNLPTKNEFNWFYYVQDGKSYEALYLNMYSVNEKGEIETDNDIWVSLKSSDEDIIEIELKEQACHNIKPISIRGAKIYHKDGKQRYFSLPYSHTKYGTYGYYWNSNRGSYIDTDEDGVPINPLDNTTGERGLDSVGSIRANDIVTINSAIGFAFYIDSKEVGDTTPVLCHYEMLSNEALKETRFKLYVQNNRILVDAYEYGFDDNLTARDLFGVDVEYDKWYYISLGNQQKLYSILDEDYTGDDPVKKLGINLLSSKNLTPFSTLDSQSPVYDSKYIITQTSFFPGSSYLKTNPGIEGPSYGFHFGGDNVEGVYISGIGGTCKSFSNDSLTNNVIEDKVASKILRPDLHTPYLKLLGYKDGHYTDEIVSSKYLNTSLNSAKGELSFYINSEIYNKVLMENQTEFDYIVVQVINNRAENKIINQKLYNGYVSGKDTQLGMFPITEYLEDSFTLNFKDIYDADPQNAHKNLIEQLSTKFVTKHGTWGGYNGGCNGHLLYFDGDKNLVMEAHGDDYIPYGDSLTDKELAQHPKGVGKETLSAYGTALLSDDQTGYGSDVFWDKFTWDQRKYKNYLRTGTSLVSNKYFSYGRVDVTMKIPKLNVGKYEFGICPALWFFHYIETYPEIEERWDHYPYKNLAIEGGDEIGEYRVLNNEIDIELPSHLINGKTPSFSKLASAYFATWEQANLIFDYDEAKHQGYFNTTDYDHMLIDDQTHITVDDVLYRYKGRGNDPHIPSSWIPADYGRLDTRCWPSFRNCKFNMWIGEYNSGDGWTATEEEYFDANYRENYQSMLTRAADNWYGYADNKFHKWSIVWTPTKSVLLIDDVPFRVGRGYIPVNVMKYTAALWFPTIPRAIVKTDKQGVSKYKKTNDNTLGGVGLLDTDNLFEGIGDNMNGTRALLQVTDETDIGTWAGRRAYWEAFHLDISEIKYTRYADGEIVSFPSYVTEDEQGNPIIHTIESETIRLSPFETAKEPPVQPGPGEPNLLYLGESYPESGLRILTGEQDTMETQLISTVFITLPGYEELWVRNKSRGETEYTQLTDNIYLCNRGDVIDYRIVLYGYDTIEETTTLMRNGYIYYKMSPHTYTEYMLKDVMDKLSTYDKDEVSMWAVMTDFHLFTPESKDKATKDAFDNTHQVVDRGVRTLKTIALRLVDLDYAPLNMIALTGDMCGYSDELQTANVKSTQISKNITKVYNALEGCASPFMGIPGNHDVYGGGDQAHKNDLVQVHYDPTMLYKAFIDKNPYKSRFKFLNTQYICSSYFDTSKIRYVFLDTYIPEVVCRYNFHSGMGGEAEAANSTTGPCYGGENQDLAIDTNGSFVTPSEVENVMSAITVETKAFLANICLNLGSRKLVIFSHQCTKGVRVHQTYTKPLAGVIDIDTRLTPMMYDAETFPYPKDAKFYTGVSSYAAAFWLGHEELSKNTDYKTNDIWNNGWSEYGEPSYWKDWMTLIKENLASLNVSPDRVLINCFGHCHTDNQAFDEDSTLYVSTQYSGSQKSGSNDTLIGTADHRHYNQFDNFEGPYHTKDKITETAFDIYVYNHNTNQIDVIRYGNGCSRKFVYACVQDAWEEDNYELATEEDYDVVPTYTKTVIEGEDIYTQFELPLLYMEALGNYIEVHPTIREVMVGGLTYYIKVEDATDPLNVKVTYKAYTKPTLYANHPIHHPAVYEWTLDRTKVPPANITGAETIPTRLDIYIADLTGAVEFPDEAELDITNILTSSSPHAMQYMGYKEWYKCKVDALLNATLYLTPTNDRDEGVRFDEDLDPSEPLNGVQIPLYLTTNKKYWYCIYDGNDKIKSGTFINTGDSIEL